VGRGLSRTWPRRDRGILQEQMAQSVDEHLDPMASLDQAHRRNGCYGRHLLTELGEIVSVRKVSEALLRGPGAADQPSHGEHGCQAARCRGCGVSCPPAEDPLPGVDARRRCPGPAHGQRGHPPTGAGGVGAAVRGQKGSRPFSPGAQRERRRVQRFLNDLFCRGLTGEDLEMICVDCGAGLLAALPDIYPRVSVQRC
jgi:hypothetical protein